MRNRARTLIATTAIAACSFAASGAAANCVLPEPQLQGTVPADGATDVPLDTAFVFFAVLQPLEVTLDDVPLTRDGKLWRAPQALDPETTYELTVQFPHPNGSDGGDLVSQTFTTGTELAAGTRPPKPTILDDQDGTPPADHASWSACERYADSVGCADSDPPPWVRLEATPSSAVGWVVRAIDAHSEFDSLWPASCSNEIVWRGYAANYCFDITAIDSAGRLSEPTQHCVQNVDLPNSPPHDPDVGTGTDADDDDQTPDTGTNADASAGDRTGGGSSCSSASAPTSSPLWLALFVLLMLRRRE